MATGAARVFITVDFPAVENRFARAREIGAAAEVEGKRERKKKRAERGRKTGERNRSRKTRRKKEERVRLRAVLYKPTTTTARLPFLCRELITNPIARPPSYLHPSRLTFSTLSSILSGFQSASYLHARSAKIPS